jgi:signal transduction histidine kinase
MEGRELDAERLYEQAIRSARANGFVHNEALANELAARFYAARGLETSAHAHLRNARQGYLRWGADGKVGQLDQLYPDLGEQPFSPAEPVLGSTLQQVDALALVKASQAVSSELELGRLLETLMDIALKDAGAQRGVLILLRGNQPQIEAEAITAHDAVTVHFRQAVPTPGDLPDSILRYVIRTQESIVLDDASTPNEFSADEYVQKKHARSVLCLPLVTQASLKGALYLENNLASHVFTPYRISVLGVVVAQASISLDHARLVAELTQENNDRNKAEAALREAQTELAHVSRLTTMGELAASIAHEVNQPLASVVNNASACLRWLAAQNLEEAKQSAARVVADGHRAGEIIGRIRALAKKAPPQKDWLDLNETIGEVIAMARSEVQRNGVSLQTELENDLPLISGDRIQLQQVMLDLLINAIEAMRGVDEGPRELWISSEKVAEMPVRRPRALQTGESEEAMPAERASAEAEWTHVLIAVRDSGPGLDPNGLDRLFNAFYTTKPQGMGMGLAISRSIIEAHGGRLWATANASRGAAFQFALPIREERVS